MRKIAIAVFVVIFAYIVVWDMPKREAEAFVPVVVPVALCSPIGCALLAAGVIVATAAMLETAVQWWYSTADEQSKQDALNAVDGSGVYNIPDTTWNSVSSFAREHFIPNTTGMTPAEIQGYVPIDYMHDIRTWEPGQGQIYYIDGQPVLVHRNGVSFIYNGNTCPTGSMLVVSMGTTFDGSQQILCASSYSSAIWCKYKFSKAGGLLSIVYYSANENSYHTYYTWPSTATFNEGSEVNIEYTGSSVLADINYDIKDSMGNRFIVPPATVAEIIGKTYDDIVYNPENEIPAMPVGLRYIPGDGSISLDWDAVPGANYYQVYVAGVVIAAGITATNYLVGNLTNDISYDIGVSAVNDVGTSEIATTTAVPSAVAAGDVSANGIDLTPLKVLGVEFTNKFPFSLPWDLVRALQSVYIDTSTLSDIQLQFYMPFSDTPINFSLQWPEFVSLYARWVRAAFLIITGIGLVYSTRKLLGGAQ